MARKVRIQYPGAIYHVMNRRDRREAIFEDDEDRERLLQTLTQACQVLRVASPSCQGITPHRTANKPTTVQAMAMSAATSDSPAISPEATGT
jgi:hypothetical protein